MFKNFQDFKSSFVCWKNTMKVCLWNELMIDHKDGPRKLRNGKSHGVGLGWYSYNKFVFIDLESQVCICC